VRFRRGPVDRTGRHRHRRPRPRAHNRPLRALLLPWGGRLRRPPPLRHAQAVRRPPRTDGRGVIAEGLVWKRVPGASRLESRSRMVASGGEGTGRSRWRSWFTSTGAPANWALVRYLVCGLFAGLALGAALPEFRATLLAGLSGAVVAAAGSMGPSGIARRVT